MKYLAPYVFRVTISDNRILECTELTVTYRSTPSGTKTTETRTVDGRKFVRAFLQHVLPSGFRKLRYFGLHHSSKRPALRLLQASMALQAGRPMPGPVPESAPSRPSCPRCRTPMAFEGRIQGAKPAYRRGGNNQRAPP